MNLAHFCPLFIKTINRFDGKVQHWRSPAVNGNWFNLPAGILSELTLLQYRKCLPLVRRKSWQVALILSRCEAVWVLISESLFRETWSIPTQRHRKVSLPFLRVNSEILADSWRGINQPTPAGRLSAGATIKLELFYLFHKLCFPPESWRSDSHPAPEWSMVGSL